MDSVGGTQSNEERGAERLMDSYLKSIGLQRKKIAKDGSCLFRAVAEQVLHCQSLHTEVRAKCVEFLRKNRESYEAFIEGDFEDYLFKLQDPQHWVGEVEINALAVMYKRDFLIYQEPDKPPVNITDNNFKDKVQLCFLNGNHYDSVYPVSHIKDAALCQSILYELLYDGVFKVDRGSLGPCQRISRPSDLLIDDNMNACVSSDESDLDAGDALWVENGTSSTTARTQSHRGRGRGRHLPERVRRSLNPTLFRNVEYDVWQKTKRAQQKMDYCIAAGMQFTVGDRCQVRLEGRSYNAIVKEVPPDNGLMTVYIEELGSRKQVPLWSLRPPSDEKSWSTVVHRDKRLSNGHGDWEERGRGRGRGKHVPASPSSVAQATAPGSSGRVQKQHSWPPQATVEEQAKASRKSVSSVESAFGLTEEERLAKEEEERNVALVEIQLRDEQSFPALGTDGGKKKGGEKKRSQRNKTKSPVEDVGALSPSVGERPKSSTPPLTSAAAATNTTSPTTPTPPPATPPPATPPAATPPAAKPPAAKPPAAKPPAAPSVNSNNPAWLSSIKASTPKINMAAAPPASSLTCAPTPKTNSYAVAAAPSSPPPPPPAAPPAAAPSSKPPVMGGAVPLLSLHTPPLPAASSPLSSSSPPPSSSSSTPSSVQPPTFIAPIAPSPTAAQGFLPPASLPRSSPPVSSVPQSPSPPSSSSSSSSSSSLIPQAAEVHEAPPVSAQNSFRNIGGTQTASQSPSSLPQNLSQISVSKSQTQASLTPSETQTRSPLHQNTQILMPQTQTEVQSALPQIQQQPQSHTEVTSLPQSSVPQMSLPQSSVPQMSLPQSSVTQTSLPQSPVLQTSLSQSPVLQTSLPQSPVLQTSVPQSSVLQTSLPQSPVLQTSLPQSSVLQTSLPKSSVSHLQSQSEVAQLQSSSLPSTPQASVPPSVPPPVSQPHPHIQMTQPPHPSQVPLPSVSLSSSHPSLQPQTPNNPSETPLPPPQHPQPPPESPSQSPSQPSHPPHPQLQPAPPHLQSIPGAVPLQQLSQLYQDPLYPGFPQGEKGEVAPTPSFSSSKSGDDLPQDINILKFFFNLGVKAYSMPMFQPYIYLLPLQQAHTLNPKLPSRSPSPHHVPSNPPSRQQEAHPHPHYPPTSASISPQYDHQAPPPEPPHPGDPSFTQARYPVTQPPPHRMPCSSLPWQPPPRNPSYQIVYPASNPPYRAPAPLSHGYPSAQGPRHPVYPPYPPSSLGYQPSSSPEELQVSQGLMEQHQPANVDPMPGQGPGRVPGPLESPAAANMANANGNRTVVVPGLTLKKEQGDSLTRAVLLVDPPLNNMPIITLVSNPDVKDVSMATMKPNSSPGSPLPYDMISKTTVSVDNSLTRGYRGHQKPLNPPNTYFPLRQPEPGQASYLTTVGPTESLSVGCSTEDEWEGIKPATLNHRGSRRSYRGGGGGRGRGGHDPWRGGHRRRGGDAAMGINYVQFSSSHRGRGRERGY